MFSWSRVTAEVEDAFTALSSDRRCAQTDAGLLGSS